MSRKARKPERIRRRGPTRESRACVLIVCEGEKTEPNYFHALREELGLNTVEVQVEGGEFGSAPISIVDTALALREERERKAARSSILVEYDEVWCVIDVEAPTPHDSLDRAFVKAKAQDLKLTLSNPCFEYWYLLHFERTSALMQTNRHVMDALKGHYPRYRKNDPASFRNTFSSRTEQAITHAEGVINEKHYGEDLRNCNPSTHVHRLVSRLRDIANR